MQGMLKLLQDRKARILFVYYIALLIWWVYIFSTGQRDGFQNYLFGAAYAIIALIGGLIGISVSRHWGAWRSTVGRGIIFLSAGLLAFAFGQFAWSYYNIILQVEVPYPSVADIGYVGTIPLYFLGMIFFAKAAGAKFALRIWTGKLQAIIVPLIVLLFSYWIFLRDYEFDFDQPVKIFIDFGYPLGQALTISIGILAFTLSRNFLGGLMKGKIRLLIFALTFQYVTDFSFLFQASRGAYYNGGPIDFMYATSFLIMSLGLISFRYIATYEEETVPTTIHFLKNP